MANVTQHLQAAGTLSVVLTLGFVQGFQLRIGWVYGKHSISLVVALKELIGSVLAQAPAIHS